MPTFMSVLLITYAQSPLLTALEQQVRGRPTAWKAVQLLRSAAQSVTWRRVRRPRAAQVPSNQMMLLDHHDLHVRELDGLALVAPPVPKGEPRVDVDRQEDEGPSASGRSARGLYSPRVPTMVVEWEGRLTRVGRPPARWRPRAAASPPPGRVGWGCCRREGWQPPEPW